MILWWWVQGMRAVRQPWHVHDLAWIQLYSQLVLIVLL